MRKFAAAAGAALGGLALVAATQGAAQAAPATAEAAAPSCVKADVTYLVGIFVDITNNCSTTQKVKVDYDRDYFSPCFTLAPGATASHSASIIYASRYEGLATC
ncbi:hypothetical protein PS467_19285 [Streptomyces luomodiensis]|uniref:Uncharacterized protein n=1 Tax=Streptomyces luomodiensis TaxID=3026192 RepID=A0ABY9UZU6_9ACTN|nr:hypothetical protein [Streptomyces sp. SCA4-21]WNE97320.1 hypothetical protein PS467_19285 [Streptomyces sp. SCA4-21]